MFIREILHFTNRLNEILRSSNHPDIKAARLATLKSDLEKAYQIPKHQDEKFEKENPFVIQMYRAVNEAISDLEPNKAFSFS